MEVNVKEIEYCKLSVDYQADSDVVANKRKEAVKLFRKTKIKGFRPGHAPDHVIKLRCKAQIDDWVSKEMAAQAYDDVLFETKVKPIGYPEFTSKSLSGVNYKCSMTFYKKPDFELGDIKSIKLTKHDLSQNLDTEAQRLLDEVAKQYGSIKPYDESDFIELGDQVTLDFTATVDDKPFEGSVSEGMLYHVGKNGIPGFDDNILGMSADEEREFDLTLPAGVPEVGGKLAKFKVKVHMGTKNVPATVDSELAQKVGLSNVDELIATVRRLADDKLLNNQRRVLRQELSKKLVELHDFKVPEWLANMEAQHLAMQNSVDWKNIKEDEQDAYRALAKDNVKLSLILDSIRENEPESLLTENEAINKVHEKLQMQGQDSNKFLIDAQKTGKLLGIISALREEYTLQWLMDLLTKEKEETDVE